MISSKKLSNTQCVPEVLDLFFKLLEVESVIGRASKMQGPTEQSSHLRLERPVTSRPVCTDP